MGCSRPLDVCIHWYHENSPKSNLPIKNFQSKKQFTENDNSSKILFTENDN